MCTNSGKGELLSRKQSKDKSTSLCQKILKIETQRYKMFLQNINKIASTVRISPPTNPTLWTTVPYASNCQYNYTSKHVGKVPKISESILKKESLKM